MLKRLYYISDSQTNRKRNNYSILSTRIYNLSKRTTNHLSNEQTIKLYCKKLIEYKIIVIFAANIIHIINMNKKA